MWRTIVVPNAPPVVQSFDFFISTTGSDSNPGTLVSPWAITSINTKQATYTGKRVGVLAGVYNVNSLMGSGNAGSLNLVALAVNGGTVSNQTYIGSSNASGVYTPRVSVLDAHPIQNPISGITNAASAVVTINSAAASNPYTGLTRVAIYGVVGMPQIQSPDTGTGSIWMWTITATGGVQNAWTITLNANSTSWGTYVSGGTASANFPSGECGIIGQGLANGGGSLQANPGYTTLDGLVITGSYEMGIGFRPDTASGQGGDSFGIIIQNCEICDIAGYENDNTSGVLLWNVTGATVHGNKIHHIISTSGNVSQQDNAAIFSFNCKSNVYEYNTIFASSVGIYDKNATNGNHTYRYNYIEQTTDTSRVAFGPYALYCINDSAGGSSTDVMNVHHNVFIAPDTWQGSNSFNDPSLAGLTFYNNTCYWTGAFNSGGLWYPANGSGTAVINSYNNIFDCAGAPNYQGFVYYTTGSISLSDYNAYSGSGASFCIGAISGGFTPTNTYTFANWQSTIGVDAHSVIGSPTFNSTSSLNTSGFKLTNGTTGQGTGSSNGTSGGTACDMGAWGNSPPSTIGCNF
jgi:hypothetical protein